MILTYTVFRMKINIYGWPNHSGKPVAFDRTCDCPQNLCQSAGDSYPL